MKIHRSIRNRRAFTLVETAVASLIMLGVLGVAIPNFQTAVMRIRNEEAENNLLMIYAAQKAYYNERLSKYGSGKYHGNINGLDLEIPASDHFDYDGFPTKLNPEIACRRGYTRFSVVAEAIAKDGQYTLYVTDEGTIFCKVCGDSVCTRMGYSVYGKPRGKIVKKGSGGGGGEMCGPDVYHHTF